MSKCSVVNKDVGTSRKIIHVDMDCFYAAVECKIRPDLKGKPLGVGGPPDSRGVLTTASYEARKFGVRSAMPTSQAMRLCPDLIVVRPHFELYKKESRAMREILSRFTDVIEPLSLDEAYLDVTGSPHFDGSATRIGQEIRGLIKKELNLTASVGIAPNKFLAKIASDWKKPDGQFVIRPQDIAAFMPPLKVEKIYGVGHVTAKKMHQLGLFVCGDIQKQPLWQLARWFGSRGPELYDLAFGIDDRAVKPRSVRKSLTVETTFNQDLHDPDECVAQLRELYEEWQGRMARLKADERIRGYVVKLKFQDFKTTTHETSSTVMPSLQDFEKLLRHVWERRQEPVRLIGIGVRLASAAKSADSQLTLF